MSVNHSHIDTFGVQRIDALAISCWQSVEQKHKHSTRTRAGTRKHEHMKHTHAHARTHTLMYAHTGMHTEWI